MQYTPSILLVFYGDDSTFRAKFEGEGEVRGAIRSGRLEGVIKELVDRRVKLKLAEKLAEDLAEHVGKQMSQRERELRRCGNCQSSCLLAIQAEKLASFPGQLTLPRVGLGTRLRRSYQLD